jgi:RNA polymerase sigma-70 factor (ECF subfamily)
LNVERQLAMNAIELAQIKEGDDDALNRWFEDNVDGLYAFIFYRVGSNTDLAQDITQSTFALALQKLDRYDPDRGAMLNWLRLLSRNLIRDQLRYQRRAIDFQAVWDGIDDHLAVVFDNLENELIPDDVLQRKETQELVSVVLANLPQQYQEVLTAKYLENNSLAYIAEKRQVSIDSVKSMLRRARIAFKETFVTINNAEYM